MVKFLGCSVLVLAVAVFWFSIVGAVLHWLVP